MLQFFNKKNSEPKKRQPQIRVAKSAYRKILFKRITSILGYSLVGVLIIYICFASTIMRAVPTISGAGIVPIKENTYPGGEYIPGKTILANTQFKQDKGHLERLKQAFIPSKNAAVVEVIAGPYNSIKWIESGIVTVDGKLTEVRLSEQPKTSEGKAKERLSAEYLTICISGDCTPGEGVIIKKDNIYGLTILDYKKSTNAANEIVEEE